MGHAGLFKVVRVAMACLENVGDFRIGKIVQAATKGVKSCCPCRRRLPIGIPPSLARTVRSKSIKTVSDVLERVAKTFPAPTVSKEFVETVVGITPRSGSQRMRRLSLRCCETGEGVSDVVEIIRTRYHGTLQ
jgi:hypothetical protein